MNKTACIVYGTFVDIYPCALSYARAKAFCIQRALGLVAKCARESRYLVYNWNSNSAKFTYTRSSSIIKYLISKFIAMNPC